MTRSKTGKHRRSVQYVKVVYGVNDVLGNPQDFLSCKVEEMQHVRQSWVCCLMTVRVIND